jgi:glycosyltransferase involved in cell wall biosynthesis
MRIAILVDELPTSSAPKIVGEEAFHLTELGVKCDVYVLKHRNSEIPPAHAQQISPTHLDKKLSALGKLCGWRIPTFSFFSLYHIAYPFLLLREANEKLDGYDAIIVHFASTAIFASRLHLHNAKLVLYYWDPIAYIFESAYIESWSSIRRKILSYTAKLVDRRLLSRADLVILPSKFHYERVKNLAPNKPVKIVYPGTDVVNEIPYNRMNYILAVARWERGKNPFLLIDIAKLLTIEFNEFEIYMIGPWRSATLLKEFLLRAEKRDVAKKFKTIGPKFGDELKSLYLGARCLVHTKVEAFGFTGLEATAHGCPIVFPKGSGVTELFTHGVHGYFPEENNAEEYAEYLAKLISDEGLAWKMGYEAWKIAKKYTWKSHAQELLRALS